jgi:hypothetical protein
MSEHELGIDRSKFLEHKAPPHDMPRWTFDEVMGMSRTIPSNSVVEAYRLWCSERDHAPLASVYAHHLKAVVVLPDDVVRERDKGYRKPESYLLIWERLTEWANNAKAQHDIEDPDGIVAEAVNTIARMKGHD